MAHIYKILNPITLQPVYIGYSHLSLKERLAKHVYKALVEMRESPFYIWLRDLLKAGYKPIIIQVAEVEEENLRETEALYISVFAMHHDLLNVYGTDRKRAPRTKK